MRLTVRGGIVLALFPALLACDESPTRPGPVTPQPQAVPPPPASEPRILVFLDHRPGFDAAVRALGPQALIDFDDVDARPVTDTIEGRSPFDGGYYAGRGVVFSNPNNLPLFIAPGGLPWNETNSLSIGRFPFDRLPHATESPFIEDDDLVATFEPGCSAVAFSVIDKGVLLFPDEFVQFLDAEGQLIQRAGFPQTFLGIVSPVHRIARVVISEASNDGDDVTYDDFACIRAGSSL
jgi:hypothetical protein